MVKKEELNEQITALQKLQKKCNKTINKLSLLRLFAFLALIVLGITCIVYFEIILFFITIVILIVFLILINIQEKKFQELTFYNNKIKVFQEYRERLTNGWKKFNDRGDNLGIEIPNMAFDVDIVGENSLFQYLNVCTTIDGKKKLASLLINGRDSIEEINKSSESVADYSSFWKENIEFQAYLKEFDKKIYRIKRNTIAFPKNINKKSKTLYIGLFLTVLLFLSIFFSILKVISPSFIFPIMLLQLSLSFIDKDKKLLASIEDATLYYYSLKKCYLHIGNISFANTTNIENKKRIENAVKSINKLGKINQLSSLYRNGISNLILNMLFPFNDFLILKYLKFAKDNLLILEDSIAALQHFEITASLANISFTKNNICKPHIDSNINLTFCDLKHPLIIEDDCISNSFEIKENINIITGSNMSGKTSFLRTLAINIVLMKAGTFVLASAFNSSNFKIFTSMRVKDDIQNGISTFYAELLRIKEAIDYSAKKEPIILLVDEIFKGTNMNDRLIGAKSVMKKLNLNHVILFITTHDFELCDFNEVKLNNYHFTEYYIDNKIKFDYLIKNGKCQTTNAIYLMKNTGIMD